MNIEINLNSRFRSDNLMFARLRNREDRTQVTGLIDPAAVPKTTLERKDFLKKAAKDFCLAVKDDFEGSIMFASTSGKPEMGNLILEFRVDTVKNAREVRKAFATKK